MNNLDDLFTQLSEEINSLPLNEHLFGISKKSPFQMNDPVQIIGPEIDVYTGKAATKAHYKGQKGRTYDSLMRDQQALVRLEPGKNGSHWFPWSSLKKLPEDHSIPWLSRSDQQHLA
jgi:hypothetical protein